MTVDDVGVGTGVGADVGVGVGGDVGVGVGGMVDPAAYAPIAVSQRNGFDESVHFGAVVAVAADGSIDFAVGDPMVAIYPRSATKPMQAVAMVRHGLQLAPRLLALACASHIGSPMHTAGAAAILRQAGLTPAALANIASLPLDRAEADRVIREGGQPSPLLMNCSGKHAAMLATCVHNGWAHDASYLSTDHPLQVAIADTIEQLTAEPTTHTGVDGCGAPAVVVSLAGLARGIGAIASGAAGASGREVSAAMAAHPDMVAGPGHDVTRFMRAVPGLIAKEGAEGVYVGALPDGRAIAMKVSDGSERARPVVFASALARLGVPIDPADWATPVMGHGSVVGSVRSFLDGR